VPFVKSRDIVTSVRLFVLCVCVRVCLSAGVSPELHARPSPDVLCVLAMAVPRLSSHCVAIRCFRFYG